MTRAVPTLGMLSPFGTTVCVHAAGYLITYAAALMVLLAAGVAFSDASGVLLYLALFALLPGYLVVAYMLRGPFTSGILAAMALCLGLIAQLLVMLMLWMLGALWLAYLIPVLAIAGLAWPETRRRLSAMHLPAAPNQSLAVWALAALALPILGAWGLTDFIDNRVEYHFLEQAWGVQSLSRGWPAQSAMAIGVPYSNNFAIHLWMLGAVDLLGVELIPLAGRSTPILHLALAALAIAVFSRHVLKLPLWAVALVIIKVFVVFARPPIAALVYLAVIPSAATATLSPLLGFTAVFSLMTVLHDRETHRSSALVTSGLVFAMTFLAVGARGSAGPILICGFGLLFLVASMQKRALDRSRLAYLVLSVAAMVAALAVFFTLGQQVSGTRFLQVTWQPVSWILDQGKSVAVAHMLTEAGVPPVLAASAAFVIFSLFQAGFLLPGFLYKLWLMTRETWSSAETLLLGFSIAGIAAVFLTQAGGGSQFTFIHYSNISMSILGAVGLTRLVAIFRAGGEDARTRPLKAALAATAVLAIVHLGEVRWKVVSATPLGLRSVSDSAGPRGLQALTTPAEWQPFCEGYERAEPLLAQLRGVERPIVIFLVDELHISTCHVYWWVTTTGIRTLMPQLMSMYASWTESEGDLVGRRFHVYSTALAAAKKGEVDVVALGKLAEDLKDEGPVYFVLPTTLPSASNPPAAFESVATHGELTMWRAKM